MFILERLTRNTAFTEKEKTMEKRLKIIYHARENLVSSDSNSWQATCNKYKHNRLSIVNHGIRMLLTTRAVRVLQESPRVDSANELSEFHIEETRGRCSPNMVLSKIG